MADTVGGAGSEGDPSGAGEFRLIDLLSSSVRACSRLRRFSAGEAIVREGEAGSTAFILLSGRCEVTGRREVLNVVSPGELFGEIACLEGGTRTATVRALDDCDVIELAADALQAELWRSPALLDRFLRAMARRVRDISQRERTLRDEQRGLREVLENLQPSLDRFAHHPLLSVEVRWQPLTLASGDYFDVLELTPRRFLFAVGDVMGHGAPTTPIVAMIRSQLHESATAESLPHELLAHLHRHLRRHGHPNVFMTLTLMMLDLDSSTAAFALAGPPCPLLLHDGRCSPLTTKFGWTLGYPFDGLFESERLVVGPGDAFLFYTDGVSDAARGPDHERDALGVDRLAGIFRDLCLSGAPGIPDGVFTAVKAYQAGWPFEDDATVFVVSIR